MAKILIVDDSKYMRSLLEDILLDEGHGIYQASDGEKMILLYKDVHPDIVLMDVVMPVLDGLSALEEVKKIDPDAKIIVCSAQSHEDLIQDAYAKGACDFIIKPFSVETILNAVHKVLSK